MISRRRRLSLFAFMSLVTAICVLCGICKIWLFPPTLRVNVISPSRVVVHGNVLTMPDVESVIEKYAKQQHDDARRALLTITVNENLSGPERSALADAVLQQASAHQYDHCFVQFSDLDHLIR